MAPGDLPRVLLGLARDDDFAARSLLPVEGVADAILGFHAQQAVEKSLKAVLASADVQFPYTHDLDGLIELCRGHGLEVPDALEDADQLSPYGVRMRYAPVTTRDWTAIRRLGGRLLRLSGRGK